MTTAAQALLDHAVRQSPGYEAEVFVSDTQSLAQEWSEGRPENRFFTRGGGAGIRLIQGGRVGFSYTNRTDDHAVTACIGDAVDAARFAAPDAHRALPEPLDAPAAPLDLVDPDLLNVDAFDQRSAFLETLEDRVRARDARLKKILRASYRESRHRESLASSRGVAGTTEGTVASFSLACVAEAHGETQVGYGFGAARHAEDLPLDAIVDRAVAHTLALLGGRTLPSGRYDLVLDPLVASEMLELFARVLSGEAVIKGRSFLAGKVGEAIGSERVTLIDDGRMPRGVASSLWDGEGQPTKRQVLMERGVLKGFLHDTYTARRMQAAAGGSAGRGSYKSLPGPEASNFYLEPGSTPPEALVAGVDDGIYVRGLLGLHTVDTVSGDYSLGLTGQRIEKGRLTHGVRGVTLAGTMLEFLNAVADVGSDLIWFGSVGAPTLRVHSISIGGTS